MKKYSLTLVFVLLFSLSGKNISSQDKKDQSLQKKETAAVLDFKATQGLTTNDAVTLTNKFRSALSKTKKFDVLERSEMESLMKEQDMSLSDLCDNTDCAVQVGKLLVAKKMVVGEIGKIGETYSVTARIIEVSTGKVELSENLQHKGSAESLLPVFDVLAQKLTGTYKAPRTWLYVGGAVVVGGGAALLLLSKKASGTQGIANPVFPPQ